MQQGTASEAPAFPWLASYPSDVDWAAEIDIKPMHALLEDAVARFADRPCIDFLDRRYSFAEIGRLANRAAKGFQALGVGPGVKVGLHLPNCPYSVICYYGVLKAGGTVVNYNPLYATRELGHQIDDSETDIMVTLDVVSLYTKLGPLIGASRLRHVVVCRLADALPFPRNWLYPWVMRHEVARIPVDERHVPFARLIANDGIMVAPPIDPHQADRLAAIYRRHHRGAEGGDADPRQSLRQCRAMRALVRQCARRAAADPGRPAAVPRLRHDGDHELGPVRGRGDDPDAALQAGGSPAHHRAQEADGHGRRAHLVQRHAERARSRPP